MDPYFSFIEYIRFGTNGRKPIENWVHTWEWPLSKRRKAIDFLFSRWIALDRKCARVCTTRTQTQKHATKLLRNKSFDAISLPARSPEIKNVWKIVRRSQHVETCVHNEITMKTYNAFWKMEMSRDVYSVHRRTLNTLSSVWFQRSRRHVKEATWPTKEKKSREHSSPFGVLSSW